MRKFLAGLIFCGLLIFVVTADGKKDAVAPSAPEIRVSPADRLYSQAREAADSGDVSLARRTLETIFKDFPDFDHTAEARVLWGDMVWRMLHTGQASPESVLYTVESGDTLGKIAGKYGTTVELIRLRNGIEGDRIRIGQKLSVFMKPVSIHINKSANRLQVLLDGEPIKIYPVSTGKSSTTTPEGEFVIRDRLPHPTWFHKGEVVPPDSPENELGTRWLGFDKPKYGIHGTIHPEHIGESVSSGCVRMRNEDVEELFDVIPSGTRVFIDGDTPVKF